MKVIRLSDEDAKYLYDNIDSWYDESADDGDGITDFWHSDKLTQLHNKIKGEIMSQDNALINALAAKELLDAKLIHIEPVEQLSVNEDVSIKVSPENVKPIDREELRKLLAQIIDVIERVL